MTTKKMFLLVLLVANLGVFGQREKGNFHIVAQPQVFFPTSEIKQTNGILFGGHLSSEKMLSDKLAFCISLGGGLMQGKKYTIPGSVENTYPALTIAQLRIGVKSFIYDNHLWLSALVGGGQSFQQGTNNFGFSFSPTIGYAVSDKFDVALRYDASIFKQYSINGIGISLGYHFGQ